MIFSDTPLRYLECYLPGIFAGSSWNILRIKCAGIEWGNEGGRGGGEMGKRTIGSIREFFSEMKQYAAMRRGRGRRGREKEAGIL